MKKVRIAMLLYVAVGLIPLAALSRFAWPRIEKEYTTEIAMHQIQASQEVQDQFKRSQNALEDFLRVELSREFTEFQHWRAPLNTQSQAPSVVRSSLAPKPANPLVKFYFQVRSSGSELRFSTPHQPEEQNEQLESYQSARPLPADFLETLCKGKESILAELLAILSAQTEGSLAVIPSGQDLVTTFMQARSGEKPASLQLVSNEVLLVNSNSQEVANQARTAQVNKKASRSDNVGDPWSGLKRPPALMTPMAIRSFRSTRSAAISEWMISAE